jgi:hypothetical protein
MAALTTQVITRAGITPTYAAAAATDTFDPGFDVFIHAKNTNAATRDLAFSINPGASTVPNVSYTLVAVTLPATTGDKMIGPFPANIFADPTTGKCTITPTATTNVTYNPFKLQAP